MFYYIKFFWFNNWIYDLINQIEFMAIEFQIFSCWQLNYLFALYLLGIEIIVEIVFLYRKY